MAEGDPLCDYPKLKPFVLKGVKNEGDIIGRGTYSTVEKVALPDGTICAAKRIHGHLQDPDELKLTFAKECELMSTLRHPNVVQFFGIILSLPGDHRAGELPAIVMEKMMTNLHDLLDPDVHSKKPKPENGPKPLRLPLELKCSILQDVAIGLAFLHSRSPRIVHRNLSAKNVLLTSGMVAKVADMAEARKLASTIAALMTMTQGAYFYLPAEAHQEEPKEGYDPKIDSFSFGIVTIFAISEIFPSKILSPTYSDEKNGQGLIARSELERRRKYIDTIEEQLGKEHAVLHLIKDCLCNKPAERPDIQSILERLKGAGARGQRWNILV